MVADLLELQYTVRPWVNNSIPLSMQMALAASSALETSTLTQGGTRIRGADSELVDCHVTTKSLVTPSKASQQHSDQNLVKQETPEHKWTPRSSLSLRSRHKASSQTLAIRPRGKTAPLESRLPSAVAEREAPTSEYDVKGHRDADSVRSFTPSISGKNLANWFSGLLGRS